MKISIIGAGLLGSQIGFLLALRQRVHEIFLFDIIPQKAEGQAMDINQALSVQIMENDVIGSDDFRHLEGSDIVIVTVGNKRRPGMIRDDLFEENYDAIKQTAENIKKYCNFPVVLVVTNPLDTMTKLVQKITGLPHNRVIGMGNSLDTARFREVIHRELKIPRREINCLVIGEHGENMVHKYKHTTPELEEMSRKTAITTIEKKGSTVFAPALAVCHIVDIIIYNLDWLVPVSCYHPDSDSYYGEVKPIGKDGIK